MTRFYSDEARQEDAYSLPDCEVFYADDLVSEEWETLPPGWFYWFCFPGCMPESTPFGPFDTEEEAIADCRENWGHND